MHEIKYFRLHCLLSDEHCFSVHHLSVPATLKYVVFHFSIDEQCLTDVPERILFRAL